MHLNAISTACQGSDPILADVSQDPPIGARNIEGASNAELRRTSVWDRSHQLRSLQLTWKWTMAFQGGPGSIVSFAVVYKYAEVSIRFIVYLP